MSLGGMVPKPKLKKIDQEDSQDLRQTLFGRRFTRNQSPNRSLN